MNNYNKIYLYEQQSDVLLAVIMEEKDQKLSLINNLNEKHELSPNRLYKLPEFSIDSESHKIAENLNNIILKAQLGSSKIDVLEIWQNNKDINSIDARSLCKILKYEETLENVITCFICLCNARLFFKRKRDQFFPRTETAIEELKKQNEKLKEKESEFINSIEFFKEKNKDVELPEYTTRLIHNLKLLTGQSKDLTPADRKEALKFLNELKIIYKIDSEKNAERNAFLILQEMGVFNKNSHLTYIHHRVDDTYSNQSLKEVEELKIKYKEITDKPHRKDLTGIETFTIDSFDTNDMDDAISLEKTESGYKLGIHISDIAALIPIKSSLQKEAHRRTTSIYCPDRIFNMFPPEIANDLGSLVANEVRPCISLMLDVDPEYNILKHKIIPSNIKVSRKYNYNEVNEYIEHEDNFFLNLYQIAVQHETLRLANGAANAQKKVPEIKIKDGEPHLEIVDEGSFSRNIIAEFMIITNRYLAEYCRNNFIPAIFRCQDKGDSTRNLRGDTKTFMPSYLSSTAKPHYALGLAAYIQISSPIRRFADLCNQRQVSQHLEDKKFFYERKEIEKISKNLKYPIQDANSVSKDAKRFWLVKYLDNHHKVGDIFSANVIKNDKGKALVMLNDTLINGLASVSNEVKVGDHIDVKLTAINPAFNVLRFEQS